MKTSLLAKIIEAYFNLRFFSNFVGEEGPRIQGEL